MARIKTPHEIEIIAQGGKYLADITRTLVQEVRIGLDLAELNLEAEELIRSVGGRPSFLGYQPRFSKNPFPATICTSVNEEVVHASGSRSRKLLDADILSIDIGMEYRGLYTDMAVTLGVGRISKEDAKLLRTTLRSLEIGIQALAPGVSLAEVGRKIQT
jgi:methionyl aminopeptidase